MGVGNIGVQILFYFLVVLVNKTFKGVGCYLIDSTQCSIFDHANKFVSSTSLTRRRAAIKTRTYHKYVHHRNKQIKFSSRLFNRYWTACWWFISFRSLRRSHFLPTVKCETFFHTCISLLWVRLLLRNNSRSLPQALLLLLNSTAADRIWHFCRFTTTWKW